MSEKHTPSPARPEPFGLGKWCGWCGKDIRRRKSVVWRADRRACFCDQECHDDALRGEVKP